MKTRLQSWILVVLVVIIAVLSLTECKLPSSITPRCPVKSQKWASCIATAIENTKPYLARGDFGEGFIVPKMEPLYIKRLGMVSHDVNTTISDLIVTGASDFKVTKIKPKIEDLSFEAILMVPIWKFTGSYVLDVKAGPVEINGKGPIRGEFSNIGIKIRAKFHPVTENDKTYVRFQRFQMRIRIQDGKLQLDNLFGGDPVLGDFGNQFINTRTQLIIQHLEPELERDLTGTFSKLLATLFRDVTFDEMFPVE